MEKVIKTRTRSGRLATRISLQSSVHRSTTDNVAKSEAIDKENPKRNTRTAQQESILNVSNISTRNSMKISDLKDTKNRSMNHSKQNNMLAVKSNSKSHKKIEKKTNLDENSTIKSWIKSRRINRNMPKKEHDEACTKTSIANESFKMKKSKQMDKTANVNLDLNVQSKTLISNEVLTKRRSSRISFSNFKSVQETSTPIATKSGDDLKKTGITIETSVKPRMSRSRVKTTGIQTLANEKTTQIPLQKVSSESIIINKVPIYRKFSVVSPTKTVHFTSKINHMRTRQLNRKYIDYDNSETIQSDDSNDEINGNKRKKLNIKAEKKKDVYEFEADSYEKSDSENEYDKDMIAVMKEIKKTEKKKKITEIKKLVSTKSSKTKYSKKAIVVKKKPIVEHQEMISFKTVKGETQNNNASKNMLSHVLPANSKHHTTIRNVSFPCSQSANNIQVFQNIEINLPTSSPVSIQENHDTTVPSHCPPAEFSVPDIVNSFLSEDPIETGEESSFQKPNFAMTHIRRPITNSTGFVQMNSPSRSNLVLRHGPYILQTKGNNLPSFNQEMVLNSTMVEAHDPLFRCRLSAIHSAPGDKADTTKIDKPDVKHRKATKQTTILNYIHGNEAKEPVQNCTLFDENLLISPVKISTPKRDIEIIPDMKRVLRDMTNLSFSFYNTPAREGSDVEFFAVDENIQGQESNAKPTRFKMKFPKKVEKQLIDISITGEEEAKIENATIFDSPPLESEKSVDSKDVVGIYQDFNHLEITRQSLPSFTYERKRKRPRRIPIDVDNSEDEYDEEDRRPKRSKKKGGMTKKEKKDFEAWATSFNKECEAIDQITLEVG